MYVSNGSRTKEKTAEYSLFSFSWIIENIFDLKPRSQTQSPTHISGKYQWRLVVFPRGRPMHAEDIAIFLELVSVDLAPSCWDLRCYFEITIINHKEKADSFKKAAMHTFCQNQKDRGWDSFTDSQFSKLYDPEAGFLIPSKCKDLEIRCEIKSSNKREMEFVGLKNQGATCYLNSFLQSLYHLPLLRKEVYNMPTDNENLDHISIPLALQRVFYRLQTEEDAVDTQELTQSFGWSASETFRQHDVQELSRKLLEHLEEKMKNTPSQGILAKLFRGKFYNYVKCIKVDYESIRVDEYYDISLNVRGCKTLQQSFAKYCEVETLDGDNKYNAGDYGLQAAKKGIKFESFPPIMFLHLKRFEYDFDKNRYVKVNDRLVFPPIIKLEEFLSPTADKSIKQIFHLHGVLVHSGNSVSSGHYYAFIKPTKEPQWYKFDDTRVSKASDHQAVDCNFGGFDEAKIYNTKYMGQGTSSANAYMLLYLRESELDQLLAPVREHDIPRSLVERFMMLTERKKEQKRLKEEEKQSVKIYIATEMNLYQHFGPDLLLPHNATCFTVKQTDTFSSLKTLLQPILKVPPHRLRLWNFVRRRNQTVRPDDPLIDNKPIYTAYSFGSSSRNGNQLANMFFAEISDIIDDAKEPDIEYFPTNSEMKLLYIKYYQPETSHLRYIGKVYQHSSTILHELVPHLRMMAGLTDSAPIMVFEEIKKDRQDNINLYHSIKDAELQDGDILIFQEKSPRIYDYPFPKVTDYFRNCLCLMRTVIFQPLESQGKKDNTFKLEFQEEEDTYQLVRERLSKHLKVPPDHILVQGKQWKPRFNATDNKTLLKDMIQVNNGWDYTLHYNIYDFNVEKLPDLITLNLRWRDPSTEPLSTSYRVFLEKKNTSAGEAIRQFLEKCKVEPKEKVPEFRILAIKDNRIVEVYLASDEIIKVDLHDYFVEEIQEEEKPYFFTKNDKGELQKKALSVLPKDRGTIFGGKDDPEALIQCVHFHSGYNFKNVYSGEPFFFIFKKSETLKESLERLRQKLEIEKNDMKTWKYYRITIDLEQNYKTKLRPIEDTVSVLYYNWNSEKGPCYFGMEHYNTIDRKPKNHTWGNNQRGTEKGVIFYNVESKKDK